MIEKLQHFIDVHPVWSAIIFVVIAAIVITVSIRQIAKELNAEGDQAAELIDRMLKEHYDQYELRKKRQTPATAKDINSIGPDVDTIPDVRNN